MKVHHIGYLIDNIKSAAKEFEKLGFSKTGEIVEDLDREIYILFLDNAGYQVELIQPTAKSSPIYSLSKKFRNAPYHICYETNDLQSEIDNMMKADGGYILIQKPRPAPAIKGCPTVAFLMNRYLGMIELLEKDYENVR